MNVLLAGFPGKDTIFKQLMIFYLAILFQEQLQIRMIARDRRICKEIIVTEIKNFRAVLKAGLIKEGKWDLWGVSKDDLSSSCYDSYCYLNGLFMVFLNSNMTM